MTAEQAARESIRLIGSDGTAREGVQREGVSAAFDGVLDNGADLARELELHEEATADELLLEAYRRWGEGAADRLRGTFAWAIRDAEGDVVLAARDHIGAWPLFYANSNGTLTLSSSLEALLDEPGVSRDVNRAALADHLLNRWPDPGETYYAAVRRVPPGHLLREAGSNCTVRRYWNPAPLDGGIRWVERDELGRFEELMEQAVARPLAIGQPGIFLSGGLDSVSVAAIARDLGPKPTALSVEFPGDANEVAVQRGVAAQLGLEHVMLDFQQALGGRSLLETALAASAKWPQPLANLWYPLYDALAGEGAKRGVRLVLTGGGGDEWLTVSPLLAADLLRRGDILGLYRLWATMHRSFALSRRLALRGVLWTFGSRPILVALATQRTPRALAAYRRLQRERRMPDWIAPDPELRRELEERALAVEEPGYEQGFYLREGQLSLDHSLVSLELEELHETGRRRGVAIRMPFWDPDLVDFLYRTPPDLLNDGGRSKGLIRRMLDERFPELGFERHKKVVATNVFAGVLRAEGERALRTIEEPFALDVAGVVDKTRVNSLVRGISAGEQMRESSRFWNLLSLEAWARPRMTNRGG